MAIIDLMLLMDGPMVSKVAQLAPGENDLHHHYIHMLDHDLSHQLMMDKFQSKVWGESKNSLDTSDELCLLWY